MTDHDLGAAHDVQIATRGEDELYNVEEPLQLLLLEDRLVGSLHREVILDVGVLLEHSAVPGQLVESVLVSADVHLVKEDRQSNHEALHHQVCVQIIENYDIQPVLQ
jgi:hypothetical protein